MSSRAAEEASEGNWMPVLSVMPHYLIFCITEIIFINYSLAKHDN
jgi:hypothetical protein